MRRFRILVALAASVLSSPLVIAVGSSHGSDARPTAAADRAALRDARIAQNRAIAAGDLDRVASFWTDDVTVRRALGQALSGRAAARQALESPAASGPRLVYQRNATAFDVSGQWPLAFETGRWDGRSGSASGPTVIGGRYSAQWVKRDGRWLIRSEVFVALSCAGAGCEAAAVP
jgi:ketosteroid isomerase-like protein